jgi:hypothetical protein
VPDDQPFYRSERAQTPAAPFMARSVLDDQPFYRSERAQTGAGLCHAVANAIRDRFWQLLPDVVV